jgi:hypothetical protein
VHCIVWAKELPFAKLFGEAGLANDLDMKSDDQSEEASEEDLNWHRLKENETATAYARRVRLGGTFIVSNKCPQTNKSTNVGLTAIVTWLGRFVGNVPTHMLRMSETQGRRKCSLGDEGRGSKKDIRQVLLKVMKNKENHFSVYCRSLSVLPTTETRTRAQFLGR